MRWRQRAAPPAQLLIDSSAVKAHRSASGGKGGRPIRRSVVRAAGRGTKIHALADRFCRPVAFHLTGAQVADCVAADALLDRMPATDILNGDKATIAIPFAERSRNLGVAPNIPPKSNRRWKNCFSPVLYRDRNAIERMFGRLKDFRRIATRYDRLATKLPRAVLPRRNLSAIGYESGP